MKINSKNIEKPKPGILVIPREDTNIVFKMQAVLDDEDFLKMCPEPEAPWITPAKGNKFQDVNDAEYIAATDKWAKKKLAWMVLESLKATDGLEWDTVDYSDPETWENYMNDLKSNFSMLEINTIISKVFMVSGLNQEKIEEATKAFLAGQRDLTS